jgi:hypothetical protein
MNNYIDWFEQLLKDDNFISSDKYYRNAFSSGYLYKKRDYLYKFGRPWRGKIQKPVVLDQLIKKRKSIVIGHSDIPVTISDLKKLKKFGFKIVYGINTYNLENFSYSIPLGLTNNSNESAAHNILGNTSHFKSAHENSNLIQSYDGSIYVNFNKQNNITVRSEVLSIINNSKGVIYRESEISNQGRIQFLKDLREYSIVLAPEGNGFDTHRLWETLYMGGTPLIKRSNYLPKILNELPVIVVDDWLDLNNKRKIERLWESAQSNRFHSNYLEASYWLNLLDKSC